jgi:hypothetical protein
LTLSTKTSSTIFPILLAVIFLTLVAVGGVVADVTSRAAVKIGKSSVSAARARALDRALTGALNVIINRHTLRSQRRELASKLNRFAGRANRYASRYKIVDERKLNGSYYLKLRAKVDTKRLLKALEDAGFKIMSLNDTPRVLVISATGALSLRSADSVVTLLGEESIHAQLSSEPIPYDMAVETVLVEAADNGYHLLAIMVARGSEYEKEEEEEVLVNSSFSPEIDSAATPRRDRGVGGSKKDSSLALV